MHFRPGPVWKISCLSLGLALIVSYQNFTTLSLDRIKLRRFEASIPSAYATGGDIRKIAPRRPASIDQTALAIPQEGGDLNSVGKDWMTRQMRLWTNGEDQRLLNEMNKSLQRKWRNVSVENPGSTTAGTGEVSALENESLFPALRFTAINRLQVGSSDSAHLSCLVNGGSLQLDLSRALTESMNLNVHHESSTNSNTLQLQYVW